jgi:hypothetical protein
LPSRARRTFSGIEPVVGAVPVDVDAVPVDGGANARSTSVYETYGDVDTGVRSLVITNTIPTLTAAIRPSAINRVS